MNNEKTMYKKMLFEITKKNTEMSKINTQFLVI